MGGDGKQLFAYEDEGGGRNHQRKTFVFLGSHTHIKENVVDECVSSPPFPLSPPPPPPLISLSQVELVLHQMREYVGYGPRSSGGMAVRV